MNIVSIHEDRIWETVLEALSAGGTLSRYYKVPKHELLAIMRLHGASAQQELTNLFLLTQQGCNAERDAYIRNIGEVKCYALLSNLIRSMKCWVESESMTASVRKKWKVAHG